MLAEAFGQRVTEDLSYGSALIGNHNGQQPKILQHLLQEGQFNLQRVLGVIADRRQTNPEPIPQGMIQALQGLPVHLNQPQRGFVGLMTCGEEWFPGR